MHRGRCVRECVLALASLHSTPRGATFPSSGDPPPPTTLRTRTFREEKNTNTGVIQDAHRILSSLSTIINRPHTLRRVISQVWDMSASIFSTIAASTSLVVLLVLLPSATEAIVQEYGQQVKTGQEVFPGHGQGGAVPVPVPGHVRGPVALVVDMDSRSLQHTRWLWHTALQHVGDANLEAVLIIYNDTGVYRAARTLQLPEALEALPSYQGSTIGGPTFYTILRATEHVPFDSAILVFTSRPASDEDLAQLALRTLIHKRLKLYVWLSAKRNDHWAGAEVIYRQVSERTGGALYVNDAVIDDEGDDVDDDNDDIQTTTDFYEVTLAVRDNVTGYQTTPVYVDSTVTSLVVTVDDSVDSATLTTTGGHIIDLLSEDAARQWQWGAAIVRRDAHHLRLHVEGKSPTSPGGWTGTWILTTDGKQRYGIVVTANSSLGVGHVHLYDVVTQEHEAPSPGLRLTMAGHIDSLTGVQLLNATGTAVRPTSNPNWDIKRSADGKVNATMTLAADQLPSEPFYLQLNGVDRKGNMFSRLTYVQPPSVNQVTLMLRAGSSLIVRPGQRGMLVFDIVNNASWPSTVDMTFHSSYVMFDNNLYRLYLQPYQTTVYKVNLLVPISVPKGTVDTITVKAKVLAGTALLSARLYVEDLVPEHTKPSLRYTVTGNCKGMKEEEECGSRLWRVQANLTDSSGLLYVSSEPGGFVFDDTFVAGDRTPVTVTYTSTCCDPTVNIIATDLYNNTAVYTVESKRAEWAGLNEGEIAAIVLAILVVIIIIAVVITVTVCKKRRSHTFQRQQAGR